MKIGLFDVDGHNYPNLALMKIYIASKKFRNAAFSRMFVCIVSKPPLAQYGIYKGGATTAFCIALVNWRTMCREKTGKHLKNYIWERSKNDRKRPDDSGTP